MADDVFACSQLGAGYDAVDDDASQALPGGEEALVSQPLLDSTAARAVFRCTYGCDHGAQVSRAEGWVSVASALEAEPTPSGSDMSSRVIGVGFSGAA